jgi:hypothetical protein
MKLLCSALLVAFVALPCAAVAQDAYKWADIDCAQSRIVPLPGVKCRATNVVSGGASAGGQFQRWAILGNQPYLHVYVAESLESNSYIRTTQTGPDYLSGMNQRAKSAAGAMSEAQRHGGADYYLFKANDEDCVGFRRYGPSRSLGYAWIMGGVTCAPKGTALRVR